jgi:hypothetical protein
MDAIEGCRARPHRLLLAAVAAAGTLAAAPDARADDLIVTTREHGGWSGALAALRADLAGEGKVVHVAVHAHGAPIACGAYFLQLDPMAQAAFQVGACDPVTSETPLVLIRRAALFDEGFDVPRPRTLSITAIMSATAVAGGGPQGGSVVQCSVAVRPYLDDLLHGTRVLLTPERYVLRPGSASVTASPDPGGWTLHSSDRASLRVAYEVLDRGTGEVVLHQDTTLTCGPEPPARLEATPEGPSAPAPQPKRPAPPASASAPAPSPCRWGVGRKGCKPGPLGLAVWSGFLTTAALTTSVGLFTASAYDHDSSQGLRIGGGIALGPTVIWGAIFAGLLYDLHRDRRVKRMNFWMSSHGRTLDLGGAF